MEHGYDLNNIKFLSDSNSDVNLKVPLPVDPSASQLENWANSVIIALN